MQVLIRRRFFAASDLDLLCLPGSLAFMLYFMTNRICFAVVLRPHIIAHVETVR